mmetsp:Transcript_201/g.455  ORF Transcript_201/g.455 Transcript_201/m.455 type:complete len:203 (+) Transcript_201:360-968(+)
MLPQEANDLLVLKAEDSIRIGLNSQFSERPLSGETFVKFQCQVHQACRRIGMQVGSKQHANGFEVGPDGEQVEKNPRARVVLFVACVVHSEGGLPLAGDAAKEKDISFHPNRDWNVLFLLLLRDNILHWHITLVRGCFFSPIIRQRNSSAALVRLHFQLPLCVSLHILQPHLLCMWSNIHSPPACDIALECAVPLLRIVGLI